MLCLGVFRSRQRGRQVCLRTGCVFLIQRRPNSAACDVQQRGSLPNLLNGSPRELRHLVPPQSLVLPLSDTFLLPLAFMLSLPRMPLTPRSPLPVLCLQTVGPVTQKSRMLSEKGALRALPARGVGQFEFWVDVSCAVPHLCWSGSHLFPARNSSNPSFTLANGSVCVISKSELNFFSR